MGLLGFLRRRRQLIVVDESSKGGDMDGTGDGENGEVGANSYSNVVPSAKGSLPLWDLLWG